MQMRLKRLVPWISIIANVRVTYMSMAATVAVWLLIVVLLPKALLSADLSEGKDLWKKCCPPELLPSWLRAAAAVGAAVSAPLDC